MLAKAQRTSATPLRSGVSTFQMLACVVAIGVGGWVGANYMGLNLNYVAYTALDETQLLEHVPEEWRPEKGDCPTMECDVKLEPSELTGQLEEEFATLKKEVAKLREAAMLGHPPAAASPEDEVFLARREKTIAYWAHLCEVANQVAQLDRDVEPARSDSTTGHVFDLRRRVFSYGRRMLETTATEGVDEQAVEAGNRLIEWYAKGEQFYVGATAAWDNMQGAPRSPAAAAKIESAQADFAKHSELLRSKVGELSSLLSRRYGTLLPTIGVGA
ncbi:MAG: hypothetical protein AAGJ46_04085 [Planctomycetota bacterium]